MNDDIGNYIHRVLTFLYQYFGGRVPEPHELDDDDKRILAKIAETRDRIDGLMAEVRERQSLVEVLTLVKEANSYLNLKEPWKLQKTAPEKAATTLYTASQIVASLAVFLEIFTPDTARHLRNVIGADFNLSGSWRQLGETIIKPNTQITRPKPLFRKVSEKEILQKSEGI
ncbi:MAG: hypothetical protein QXM16_03785 [Nitrososphaerota archaeon]